MAAPIVPLSVFFNGVDLSGLTSVTILKRLVHNIPPREINNPSLANADGSKLVSANYKPREIVIEGVLTANTRALMEVARDNLLLYLTPTEAPLAFDIANMRRVFTATVSNTEFTNTQGGYTVFAITFLCSDPFGYNAELLEVSMGGNISTNNTIRSFTIVGSYTALPIITITVSAVTGGSSAEMRISNPVTQETIYVTRTWVALDILQIDCKNRTVKVNGTAVEYTGKFPSFAAGTSSLLYSDNFATRTVSPQFFYQKRWL